VKDVTSTSFGLVIAYLLPGLAGLYSLSFWFPQIAELFAKFGTSESNVGLFLIVILVSITISLQVSFVRYFIFEGIVCASIRLKPEDFRNFGDKDKNIAFRVLIDEQYRYHQFWGGMFVVQPALFCGWITTSSSITGTGTTVAWIVAAAVEIATFFSAKIALERYVRRARIILDGDKNAQRISQGETRTSEESTSEERKTSEESRKEGSGSGQEEIGEE